MVYVCVCGGGPVVNCNKIGCYLFLGAGRKVSVNKKGEFSGAKFKFGFSVHGPKTRQYRYLLP